MSYWKKSLSDGTVGVAQRQGQGKWKRRCRRGASGEVTDVQRINQLTPKGSVRHHPCSFVVACLRLRKKGFEVNS